MSTLLQQSCKTPKFSLEDGVYLAKCVKCYDADTIHVVIKYKDTYTRFCCRLLGIDTAEIRSKDPDEKIFAKGSRDYLRDLILDKLVVIKCGVFDKYGRLLIHLYSTNCQEETELENIGLAWEDSLNYQLVTQGHAYQYGGGTKLKFKEWSNK
jgi:endonuclease YncB( thermonuclease family)